MLHGLKETEMALKISQSAFSSNSSDQIYHQLNLIMNLLKKIILSI